MNSWVTGIVLLIIMIVLYIWYVNVPPKGAEAFSGYENYYPYEGRWNNWNLDQDLYDDGTWQNDMIPQVIPDNYIWDDQPFIDGNYANQWGY